MKRAAVATLLLLAGCFQDDGSFSGSSTESTSSGPDSASGSGTGSGSPSGNGTGDDPTGDESSGSDETGDDTSGDDSTGDDPSWDDIPWDETEGDETETGGEGVPCALSSECSPVDVCFDGECHYAYDITYDVYLDWQAPQQGCSGPVYAQLWWGNTVVDEIETLCWMNFNLFNFQISPTGAENFAVFARFYNVALNEHNITFQANEGFGLPTTVLHTGIFGGVETDQFGTEYPYSVQFFPAAFAG